MNSELTLVNVSPPIPYFLSSTDLTDAMIYARPDVPLYKVTTDTRQIKICGGAALSHVIAILHRRDIRSDTILFPQRHGDGSSTSTGTQAPISIHRWLKRSKAPDGTPMFTLDTAYGPLIWKTISPNRHKVFTSYDLDTPIAWCYLHPFLPSGKPAFILEAMSEPLRDDIVVAYIVQRHRVTMEHRALALFVGPS